MATSVSDMTPEKLWSLNRGDNIAVRHFPPNSNAGLIIFHNLPKSVAVAFSSRWAALFPPLRFKDHRGQHPTELTIRGGDRNAAELILAWMVRCCNGRGLKPWYLYNHDEKSFTKYWDLHIAASIIGCDYLVQQFAERLQYQLDHQVHSEDIQAMFDKAISGEIDKDHEVLHTLAKHVAKHICNYTLKMRGAYETIRETTPNFNLKLESYLLPMLEDRRAQELNHRWAEQINSSRVKQRAQGGKTDPTREEEVHVNEQGGLHVQLHCPIVRVDKRGQSWAKLPLDEMLNASKFARREYFGGKTPARFRSKEGEAKEGKGVETGKEKNKEKDKASAEEMPTSSIGTLDLNHNGVGGKCVPGSDGHNTNRNARRRAKKANQKETEKQVADTDDQDGEQVAHEAVAN